MYNVSVDFRSFTWIPYLQNIQNNTLDSKEEQKKKIDKNILKEKYTLL